jgi:hypothetical protein
MREKERKVLPRYGKEKGVGRQRDSGHFVGGRIRKKQQNERFIAFKQKQSHIIYGREIPSFIHPR